MTILIAPGEENVKSEQVLDQSTGKTAEPKDPLVEEIEKEGFNIQLLDSFVRVTLLNGTYFDYSYSDFCDAIQQFQGNLTETSKEGKTLLLPRNVYILNETPTSLQIGQYFPQGIQSVNFCGTVRPSVVPNIIVTTTLKKGSTKGEYTTGSVLYWCTHLSYEELDKKIYTSRSLSKGIQFLPFSNTYDNGTLCYGGNAIIRNYTKYDLRGVRRNYDVLFDSPFNHDLGIRALADGASGVYSTASWFDKLALLAKENQPFPYSEIGL